MMASGIKAYPFDKIEPKWQSYWAQHKTFRAPDPGEPFSATPPKADAPLAQNKADSFFGGDSAQGKPGVDKPKYYVLDMFPYPSAAGLHVGHLEGYTATDIVARYKRMRGFNVLHPMGWDAFGLPAEQHALDTGTHPRTTTERNVRNFKRQIRRMGFSYDWDREVNTTDPDYYRRTQWIFTKLFEKGLAYEAEVPVNWCPALGTVLANEEVIDGKSERGGHPVIRKPMRQWVLKITAYAERLLADLDRLDWPEPIKEMQRNWIGRSEGAEVDFPLEGRREKIRVFTTRPDTLFGATYMVLAPEHPLVKEITTDEQKKAVESYVEQSSRKSDLDRTDLAKEKTGVFTGAYAINPANQKKIPVWIADYVLMSYGTGAIMAVPAHDGRDFEFAKKFGLPIQTVILRPKASAENRTDPSSRQESRRGSPRPLAAGGEESIADPSPPCPSGPLRRSFSEASRQARIVADQDDMRDAFTGAGICINSATPDGSFSIDGMPSGEAKEKITAWLEKKGIGKKTVQYKLRDWLFSRQRYWGEPIPIVHCPKCGTVPVPEKELPLALPDIRDFKPTGSAEPPLAKAADWVNTRCPKCGGAAKRETNTMPQWAGSCWYYLAYIDPPRSAGAGLKRAPAIGNPKKEKYWMPVDLYVGGAEHAVLHLLYSRFWHKVLYDLGVVSTPEPFHKLVNQGMILGEDNQKMSKSRGNVVNPDDMADRYGADSVRLYEMFMGPLEMTKPWSTQGVEGVYRFLGRVWRLFMTKIDCHSDPPRFLADQDDMHQWGLSPFVADRPPTPKELKILHQTIKKVTEDLEALRFNTAISALMIFVNEVTKDPDHSREVLQTFVLLLSPFAPHLAEELWRNLGNPHSLAHTPWPVWDERHLIEEEIEMAVLVSGKVRAKMTVAKGISDEEIRRLAREKVKPWLDGKTVKQVIVVPGRVVNIVVG